jgi:hypothetical protein
MMGLIRNSYILFLKADGLWGKWKTRRAIEKIAFRLFVSFLPRTLRYALPGRHPSDVANPEWMPDWVALYDTGEQGLTKLDRTKMPLSPVEMLPA